MSENSNVIELKKIVNIDDLSMDLIERFEHQMKEENFQGTLEDFIVKIIDFGMMPEQREAIRKHIAQAKRLAKSH